jgi:adenine-specific DNA-methyltransferase
MTKLEKEALLKPEQLSKLKELFPQTIVDGKVDFVLLKALLGEQVEITNEKYQFTWNGKQNAIANAQKPSLGTLREDKASSKDFDSTENLYIEGDNLEVLKLLQKTYQGKIKMIYIDPPYNTGNDFVYKDDFKDNVKNYLELTNQKNKSNAETSGRYHTDWLNMMYPRLMLARNLLTDDGVIFISIDENELRNLHFILDEVFGENNKIGALIWNNRTAPNDSSFNFAPTHEYVLIYSKNSSKVFFRGLLKDFSNYKNPDNDINGPWINDNPSAASGSQKDRFPITNPITSEVYFPPAGRYWAFSEKRVQEWTLTGKLIFPKTIGKNFLLKKYRNEIKSETKPIESIYNEFLTMHGTKEFRDLFNDHPDLFKYPKPSEFIKFLLFQIKDNSFCLLDFFSGSGTTAHSVMKLNAEDGGNRKYIMVQLPEKTEEDSEAYKAGFKNICEIGKERIRRAGEKVKQEMLEKDSSVDTSKLDVGFKVFKLDSTNIKPWDGTQDINQMLLEASGNVVKKDRTDLDVVHELMLMYGVFNEEVEEIKINGKILYSIGEHFLVVCLFQSITKLDIEAIIKLKPKNVIFNDAGFENDNVKINAELTLKNHGVEDIKSL